MAKSEWSAQYKHPSWQKKRLEALEYHEFTCQACGDQETTLHVHHKRYVKGRKVWEYDVSELEVLCEPCHEQSHEIKDQISEALAMLSNHEYRHALAMLRGLARDAGPEMDRGDELTQWSLFWFLGAVAHTLTFDAHRGEQTEIGNRVLELVRLHMPSATEYHRQIEVAIEHFCGRNQSA